MPRQGTRQRNFIFFFEKSLPSALPMALGKDPENCNFFYIPLSQTIYIYIYIHQSSHLYHQHALYITSTHIFNKSIENPSQMHQSSTSQVYYYKFNITKFNIPTAATETAGVAPRTAVKDRTAAKG